MVLTLNGCRVLRAYTARTPSKVGQWLPRRECSYWLRLLDTDVSLLWRPRLGICATGLADVGTGRLRCKFPVPNQRGDAMKRRQLAASEGKPLPPAASESKLWGKQPRLLEHLTATAYEDGSPRQPGYLWLETVGQAWSMVLFDRDACARLPVRAMSLDDLLTLVEKLLSAEDAPWMIDQYMLERAAQKKKKKAS